MIHFKIRELFQQDNNNNNNKIIKMTDSPPNTSDDERVMYRGKHLLLIGFMYAIKRSKVIPVTGLGGL
jgi:hypothetical protein